MKHVYGLKNSHQLIPINRGKKAFPLPPSIFQLVESLTFFSSDIIYAIPNSESNSHKSYQADNKDQSKASFEDDIIFHLFL
jgi:hypothetical protein